MARLLPGMLVMAAALPWLAACADSGEKAADSEAEAAELREAELDAPDIAIADETPVDPAGAQAADDRARAADPLAGNWPEAPPPAATDSSPSGSTPGSTPGEAR